MGPERSSQWKVQEQMPMRADRDINEQIGGEGVCVYAHWEVGEDWGELRAPI